MAVPSPLPPRNGVNATRLRLPASGWPTAQDYVLHRFGHVDPDGIRARFARGEVVVIDAHGLRSVFPLTPAPRRECVFEHVYFARPDARLAGLTGGPTLRWPAVMA